MMEAASRPLDAAARGGPDYPGYQGLYDISYFFESIAPAAFSSSRRPSFMRALSHVW